MDTASSKSLAVEPSIVNVTSARRSSRPSQSSGRTSSGSDIVSSSTNASGSVAKPWSSATARISDTRLSSSPSTRATRA